MVSRRNILSAGAVLLAVADAHSMANRPMANNQGEDRKQPEWLIIHDTSLNRVVSFDEFMESRTVQEAHILFLGEYHDHTLGHVAQHLVLDQWRRALWRKAAKSDRRFPELAVSLEMFERDVQGVVDGYVDGGITEEQFLRLSRPWDNYEQDYRPLVESAIAHHQPVLAANVPRRYASFVANNKTDDVYAMPDVELSYMAPRILAPRDNYFTRFEATMVGHVPPEMIWLYYESQCLKDDTMAMSVANFMNSETPERPRRVAQFTGAFHTDYSLGLTQKVALLLPDRPRALVTILKYNASQHSPSNPPPVPSELGPDVHIADYVMFAPDNCPGGSTAGCVGQCPTTPPEAEEELTHFEECVKMCSSVC